MDINEWLQYGIDMGFCSKVTCFTHDGVDMSQEETNEFEDGYDPCITVVRIWEQ